MKKSIHPESGLTFPARLLLSILLFVSIALQGISQVQLKSKWWLEEPYRIIQTNLREIDAADFDVEKYVNSMKEMGVTAVLINVGGIVANYYTELPFHYKNPNLKFDMLRDVTERLHQEGIRVIGRFDFSKVNEAIAAQNPGWLYKSVKGENVNYNGQVHTCLNGGYQQEYLFKILDEALDKIPLDGVFFNMIGYVTQDYSHNYHGICQSDACRERFRKWSDGEDLPIKEDNNNAVFRKYAQFKKETSDELFFRVQECIRSHGDHIAINTYTAAGTDFVRSEANSHAAFNDNFVPWEYQASHNVKSIQGTWKGKLASNASVHFFGYPARHSSESPWLIQQRLFQNMMHGAGLDFYCIGRLDNLEDRAALENIKNTYQFHKKNERYFTHTHTGNKILLLYDNQSGAEYNGIFEMLSENHLLFDVMNRSGLGNKDMPRQLESYNLLILPDVSNLSDEQCSLIDKFVETGGKILCTGFPSVNDEFGNPLNRLRLKSLGVAEKYTTFEKTQGIYYRIFEKDKTILKSQVLENLDLVYAWEDGMHCTPDKDATGLLGFIPPAMIGPPEKCYYTEVTDIPGLIFKQTGKGKSAFFTFRIGAMYHHTRQYGHAELVLSAIKNLLAYSNDMVTDAGPLVELSRQISNKNTFEWIGLLNHTGQLGNGFQQPVSLGAFQIKFISQKPVKKVMSLANHKEIPFSVTVDGWTELKLPGLNDYEVLLIEY